MSFCFSLLNTVNFYGHLFPLLISIHPKVSRAHALEEHKTRGHQSGAGQREEGSCLSFPLGVRVHTPVCFPRAHVLAAPPWQALCTGMEQIGFVSLLGWLRVSCSGHTRLPWGSVGADGPGHGPRRDSELSGRRFCRDRTRLRDWLSVGRSRGGGVRRLRVQPFLQSRGSGHPGDQCQTGLCSEPGSKQQWQGWVQPIAVAFAGRDSGDSCRASTQQVRVPCPIPFLPENHARRLPSKSMRINHCLCPLNNSITSSRTDLNHPNGPEADALLPEEQARRRL